MDTPELDQQREFWDEWNIEHRVAVSDELTTKQANEAHREAQALRNRWNQSPLRILEVGCGTGWLAESLTKYGQVTATDLSANAIAVGKGRGTAVEFLVGDFATLELDGPFDLVVSADVIAHVADQQLFVDRIADLTKPGGVFLCMTQNNFVWSRSSYLTPQKLGQLRNWPTLRGLRTMFGDAFEITRVGSIVPGGDRGILRLLNSRWLRGGFRVVRLERVWRSTLERARIGRELVVSATRQ